MSRGHIGFYPAVSTAPLFTEESNILSMNNCSHLRFSDKAAFGQKSAPPPLSGKKQVSVYGAHCAAATSQGLSDGIFSNQKSQIRLIL
jgi:hypothetical protein